MHCTVEIISIGNELLIGKILNTNAKWLARSITKLGGKVNRISTIGDTSGEISSTLHSSLSKRPVFIIITGGLGPTFDDKTVDSISDAIQKPLQLNEEAFDMIKEKYREYGKKISKKIILTPARIKMAKLPIGAIPLPNPVGTAPGVFLVYAQTKIIALPGVPEEMKTIFSTSVIPLIKESVGDLFVCEKSLKVTNIIESEIAPLIDTTMHLHPRVYIKSHPKAPEPLPHIELHFSTKSKNRTTAERWIDNAVDMISHLICDHGGKIDKV